jgi:hypothetical protein
MVFLLCLVSIPITVNAQTPLPFLFDRILSNSPHESNDVSQKPVIGWKGQYLDAGYLELGVKKVLTYRFENNGGKPLEIKSASCSCNTAHTKVITEHISPGGRGSIEVEILPIRRGEIYCHILVQTNTSNSSDVLILQGIVP